MRGQACSWEDMETIRMVMKDPERFKKSYESMMKCAARQTRDDWEKTLEVMDECRLSGMAHVQPTHVREIARLSPRESWADWVQRCEIDQFTVVELRQALRQARSRRTIVRETGATVADLNVLVAQGKTFGTIYADPPWLYDNQGTRAATGNHYKGLTVDELCELPVKQLAADDAHLHMWTTNGFLFEAPRIFAAWGFEFRSSFVWVKKQIGIGNYWRNSHEILLTAIRGDAKRFADKTLRSWLLTPRGKRHSNKPDQVRGMVEKASPGPRLELFGRSHYDGWTVWGDQAFL